MKSTAAIISPAEAAKWARGASNAGYHYRNRRKPVKPLDDPDFIGAEAALRRASAKAIAKARAAGLEPIVSNPADLPKES